MLNAGVIGLGVGERHLAALARHPHIGTVLAYDIDAERLARIARQYGATPTGSARDILTGPDIDIAVIASYDADHFDQVLSAMQHGKHVFAEKPICVYGEQLKALRAAHRGSRLGLSSNLILRKAERFVALRQQIRSGALGDIYRIDAGYWYGRLHKLTDGWRGKQHDYSVTLGGGIHLLDLIIYLLGERMQVEFATGNARSLAGTGLEIPSCVSALLTTQSGCIVQLVTDYGSVYPHYHDLRIFGTRGVFLNGIDNAVYSMGRDISDLQTDSTAYPASSKAELLIDFVDEICLDKEPSVDVDDIFHAAELAIAIETKLR